MSWALILALLSSDVGPEHELYVFAAADVWPAPQLGFHGIAFAGYRYSGLPKGAQLSVVYNTDTLSVGLERLCWGTFCVGAQLRGEYAIAGLLPDYYQRGLLVDSRGFNASYLQGSLQAKWSPGMGHYLDYALTGRRWFFSRTQKTASDLRLPSNRGVIEQWLGYTFWGHPDDPSLRDWHRPTPRFSGFAFGVRLGLSLRLSPAAWGAPQELRNTPKNPILMFRQWARFGLPTTDPVRLQLSQWSSWGINEDDLTRPRLGGLNPYVVPLAGAPWAAWLSERFVAFQLSAPIAVWGEVELSPLIDLIYLEDPERADRSALSESRSEGWLAGLGLLLDMRLGAWQVDVKAGWAPPLRWQRRQPHFSAYLLVGRRIL